MEADIKNEKNILFFVVVNSGMGSKVLIEAKKVGVTGGTIFLGKGTVKSHVLEFLGLDQTKKEIVLMITKGKLEDLIHNVINKKFALNKHNHGIAFSLPIKSVLGGRNYCTSITKQTIGGRDKMAYEVIFTIVERGFAEEVVGAATLAGAEGATIINARGSGIHEDHRFLSLSIEPEKEIVMIITEKEKTDNIVDSIEKNLKINEPGKGIMFVLDVNKTSGLFQNKN